MSEKDTSEVDEERPRVSSATVGCDDDDPRLNSNLDEKAALDALGTIRGDEEKMPGKEVEEDKVLVTDIGQHGVFRFVLLPYLEMMNKKLNYQSISRLSGTKNNTDLSVNVGYDEDSIECNNRVVICTGFEWLLLQQDNAAHFSGSNPKFVNKKDTLNANDEIKSAYIESFREEINDEELPNDVNMNIVGVELLKLDLPRCCFHEYRTPYRNSLLRDVVLALLENKYNDGTSGNEIITKNENPELEGVDFKFGYRQGLLSMLAPMIEVTLNDCIANPQSTSSYLVPLVLERFRTLVLSLPPLKYYYSSGSYIYIYIYLCVCNT